jgi:hypothetical protein
MENQELETHLIEMEYERSVDKDITAEYANGELSILDEYSKKYTTKIQSCVHNLENHVSTTTFRLV